ncbi:hypothetical protein ACKFKH_18905 [Phormidesmis sp. 146-20]
MQSRRLPSIFTFSTCLLTAAFTLSANSSNAQGTTKKAPVNPYPEQVVQIFVDSCTSGGKSVDPAVMRKICSCSIDGIQNQYTLTEFIKISDELGANKPMRREMTQIVQSCAAQALK